MLEVKLRSGRPRKLPRITAHKIARRKANQKRSLFAKDPQEDFDFGGGALSYCAEPHLQKCDLHGSVIRRKPAYILITRPDSDTRKSKHHTVSKKMKINKRMASTTG